MKADLTFQHPKKAEKKDQAVSLEDRAWRVDAASPKLAGVPSLPRYVSPLHALWPPLGRAVL